MACRPLDQPHTGKAIRKALEDTLQKYGFEDSKHVFRYVTDQGANIICGLKPYVISHAVPTFEEHLDLESDAEEVADISHAETNYEQNLLLNSDSESQLR